MLIKKRLKLIDVFPEIANSFADAGRKRDELLLIRKDFISEITEKSKKDRSIVSRISTANVDRDGEILDPKGLDDSHYRKNPVVLWAHSYQNPEHVIGKNIWIRPDGESLLAKTVFAKSDFAEQVYKAYTEDINGQGPLLKAWSVGFLPLEWQDNPKEMKDVKKLYTRWDLLEYSAVPIPSNPEALSLSIKSGLVSDLRFRRALEEGIDIVREQEDDPVFALLDEIIARTRKKWDSVRSFREAKIRAVQEAFQKKFGHPADKRIVNSIVNEVFEFKSEPDTKETTEILSVMAEEGLLQKFIDRELKIAIDKARGKVY